MTQQGRGPSDHERWALLGELQRLGFSAEEAELGLRDAGMLPPPAAGNPAGPVHAVPGGGAPGYAYTPGYHHPPGYPLPGPAAPREAGRTPYLLGLLAWVPIPVVGAIAAGVAMAAALPGQQRRSALAAENARHAANWGLTYALGMVLSIATTFAAVLVSKAVGIAGPEENPWQLGFLLPVLPLGLMHLVITAVGLRRTTRGELFRAPGLPFFRPRPAH